MSKKSSQTKTAESALNNFHPSVISAFPESVYRGFMAWPDPTTKNLECVHIAKLHIGGQDVEYYVKLYPHERGKSKGLANEVIGYLLLFAFSIPQPASAHLVKIPIDELANPPQTWVKNMQGQGKSYWGFCSEKLPGKSACLHFGQHASDILKNDLEGWDRINDALAADEHMAHTDRHFNNVIRLDTQTYALIDNGKLITETKKNWGVADMSKDRLYRHRLSEHLWQHKPPNGIASAAALAAKEVSPKYSAVKLEIEYWLTQLGLPRVEIIALLEFLSWRASHLESLIKKRYGLLV